MAFFKEIPNGFTNGINRSVAQIYSTFDRDPGF